MNVKGLFSKLASWFGYRKPRPHIAMGIWGVTEDGCYIVCGEDGVMRKSPPLNAPSASPTPATD